MQIIQKYCLFSLKSDHFRFAAIFQCQKVGTIKNWLNSIISNHECTNKQYSSNIPIIKFVEATHIG